MEKNMFPKEIGDKVLAYIPSDGHKTKEKYTEFWKEWTNKNGAEFIFVDNMETGEEEKIRKANIVLISGGNTFELLNNLRNSGLDKELIDFVKRDDVVLAGFSAGAIVMTPRINIASMPSGIDPTDMIDVNLVGIEDLTGLNILDFEVLPHFYEETDKRTWENYQSICPNKVITIKDDEVRVINL